jgi:hypothetical protein
MTMPLLLQIVAVYLATSVMTGLPLGVALGTMIRRADRRHRQHVALLMRSYTRQGVEGWQNWPRMGGGSSHPLTVDESSQRNCAAGHRRFEDQVLSQP